MATNELEKLIDELRQVKRGQKSFTLADIRDLIERAADKLDATKPERAPVDGQCFRESENDWVFYNEQLGMWQMWRGEGIAPMPYPWPYCFCCGAALRNGYAERGGSGEDTRRVDEIAQWFLTRINAEAAPYMMGEEGEIIVDFIKADGYWHQVKASMLGQTASGKVNIRAAIDATSPAAPGDEETEKPDPRCHPDDCADCEWDYGGGTCMYPYRALRPDAAPGGDETGDDLNG